MSGYHQLWGRPSKADLKSGWDLVQQRKNSRPRRSVNGSILPQLRFSIATQRPSTTKKRAAAYANAMKACTSASKDREAGVFYAAVLLGSEPDDDPTLANPKKAVAILSKLFDEQPDHPGIAHYIIHACDNPAMANLGLAAARKYAGIAPSSAHAVHMPSHIFARLGSGRIHQFQSGGTPGGRQDGRHAPAYGPPQNAIPWTSCIMLPANW